MRLPGRYGLASPSSRVQRGDRRSRSRSRRGGRRRRATPLLTLMHLRRESWSASTTSCEEAATLGHALDQVHLRARRDPSSRMASTTPGRPAPAAEVDPGGRRPGASSRAVAPLSADVARPEVGHAPRGLRDLAPLDSHVDRSVAVGDAASARCTSATARSRRGEARRARHLDKVFHVKHRGERRFGGSSGGDAASAHVGEQGGQRARGDAFDASGLSKRCGPNGGRASGPRFGRQPAHRRVVEVGMAGRAPRRAGMRRRRRTAAQGSPHTAHPTSTCSRTSGDQAARSAAIRAAREVEVDVQDRRAELEACRAACPSAFTSSPCAARLLSA